MFPSCRKCVIGLRAALHNKRIPANDQLYVPDFVTAMRPADTTGGQHVMPADLAILALETWLDQFAPIKEAV